MARLRGIKFFWLLVLAWGSAQAQQQPAWIIESEKGGAVYDWQTGLATATNVTIIYGNAILTADEVALNQQTGLTEARGNVRIQQGDQIWVGDTIRYNFKTRQMEAEEFRTGQAPVFAGGSGLAADITNNVYTATNAFITTEDIARPASRIRARYIKIIPGDRIIAYDAVLYAGPVPVFYFPYFTRRFNSWVNHFNFTPGYRSSYGPFLETTYNWALNEQLSGALHLDWRQRRGVGFGPDFNYDLGRWGEGSLKTYYLHDDDPTAANDDPEIPTNRGRVHFEYLAFPWTNVSVRSQVRYQSDSYIVREFYENEYRRNSQPSTYLEVNKFWDNFSLDVYAQPRVNDFFETVERLPDIRLTGYRQQIGKLPLFYESESSAGYYRRLFPETNTPVNLDYEAARADTYHQIVAPHTLFGFLNLNPRVGGRFTYYSEAEGPGGVTDEVYRGVFNTGMEMNLKANRVWPSATNRFLQVNGLRHIAEPSLNYVFVPNPSHEPDELPQFDYETASLRMLPLEFPDYNAIDSVDSQNVLRMGFRNKLQTKRRGQIVNLVDWDVYTDWRLDPHREQKNFSDIYSDLVLRPTEWLRLESLTRTEVDSADLFMSFTSLTVQPNDLVAWSFGHWYLQDDIGNPPRALGEGNNLFLSRLLVKLDENWALQMRHQFEAEDGRLEEQSYSIYRDFRSWTGALQFRFRDERDGEDDFTVAFTFSLKAFPRYSVGGDSLRNYWLLGR